MCGRSRAAGSAQRYSTAVQSVTGAKTSWQNQAQWSPGHNISPGKKLPVLYAPNNVPTDLTLRPMHWGLHPSWSKPDSKPDFYRQFNCRSETCATSPVFGRLMRSKRCVVLLDGFYEWAEDDMSATNTKQPYYLNVGHNPMMVAGLYDCYEGGESGELWTVTIITTEASSRIKWLHSRMPVVLQGDAVLRWLGGTEDQGSQELRSFEGEELTWHPTTKKMNKTNYEEPDAGEPVKIVPNARITDFFGGGQPKKSVGSPPSKGVQQNTPTKPEPVDQETSATARQIMKTDAQCERPCQSCTFLNPPGCTNCSMCAAELGVSLGEAKQQCVKCTFMNEVGVVCCGMCQAKLSGTKRQHDDGSDAERSPKKSKPQDNEDDLIIID
eukprot:TRINITY_DN27975_c0_g1_i1.p1 TRINITY_DN27975_c0_g1~~TRINITY_DN27975_c0_g1_i1.p1  ORF type:complete len:382 (+),score=54.22 TRINITY_DN27975_c0_g1_i1:232-1377(+)